MTEENPAPEVETPPVQVQEYQPPPRPATPVWVIANDLANERDRQNARFGEQNHPDLADPVAGDEYLELAENLKLENNQRSAVGTSGWDLILLEEVYEALSAEGDADRRHELVQVAAVAMAQIEAIDRRNGGPSTQFMTEGS